MSSMKEDGRALRFEIGRWGMYTLGLLIIAAVVMAGLNYAGVFAGTVVERKVFENSFQIAASYAGLLTRSAAIIIAVREEVRPG